MFNEILGQEKAVATISNLITQNRFPHSLLFYGPQGVGKFTLAKSIVKYFNCPNSNPEVKGRDQCSVCEKIEKEIYYDLDIERTEKYKSTTGEEKESKQIKVEQIRDLIKKLNFKPVEGDYKFFIIDGADLMNDISENSFLKTLEEPLPNNYIILISHNINNILPTILSRCIKIKFESLKEGVIQDILEQKFHMEETLAEKISFVCSGSLYKAKLLIENNRLDPLLKHLSEIVDIIISNKINIPQFFQTVDTISELEQYSIEILLEFLLLFINESYFYDSYSKEKRFIFKNYLNLKNRSIKSYNAILDEIIKARYLLTQSMVNVKLLLENLMIQINNNMRKG